MKDYLITTTEPHYCDKCGKPIEVGARAIKKPPRRNEFKPNYSHEGCYEPPRPRKKLWAKA